MAIDGFQPPASPPIVVILLQLLTEYVVANFELVAIVYVQPASTSVLYMMQIKALMHAQMNCWILFISFIPTFFLGVFDAGFPRLLNANGGLDSAFLSVDIWRVSGINCTQLAPNLNHRLDSAHIFDIISLIIAEKIAFLGSRFFPAISITARSGYATEYKTARLPPPETSSRERWRDEECKLKNN